MPRRHDLKSILVIGSGPIVIGQACEFDYSGTQACRVLREEGYRVILANSNPATIMTDPATADATYVEPLTPEVIEAIIIAERPDALLPTLGGQTALNLTMALVERASSTSKRTAAAAAASEEEAEATRSTTMVPPSTSSSSSSSQPQPAQPQPSPRGPRGRRSLGAGAPSVLELPRAKHVGILAMEVYFPDTFVDQADLELADGAPPGKYTQGLGQLRLGFAPSDAEDAVSMALTAVNRLMEKTSTPPAAIGSLQVGTESSPDRSKSVKTALMRLFEPYGVTDVDGVDCVNA